MQNQNRPTWADAKRLRNAKGKKEVLKALDYFRKSHYESSTKQRIKTP